MMPIVDAVHLCVDMQRIFAKGGVWETPWMERVLPTIADIAARHAARTVFTRFITPATPAEAPGQWRPYYERWKIDLVTAAQLPETWNES
jgi:nicotinamidase-related amidase